MTRWRLLLRSLAFHLRSHVGVIVGAAIGTAALSGALFVGDSVRASLLRKSLQAIGPYETFLGGGDRFFRVGMGESIQQSLPGTAFSPVLALRGIAVGPDGSSRLNQANVLGVRKDFFGSGGKAPFSGLAEGVALLNTAAARQLNVKTGDELLIRVPKPGLLSREITLTEREGAVTSIRVSVGGVIPSSDGGDFSLARSQLSPANIFVEPSTLSVAVGLPGKANLLLARSAAGAGAADAVQLQRALETAWALPDAALEIRNLSDARAIELRSSRVFMDAPVAAAATGITAQPPPWPILTYLANLLWGGTNSTPYSFITAAGPPYTPEGMRSDEIILSAWLAEDLGAKPGSTVYLSYFLPESGANLREATNAFKVRAILPQEMPWNDRTLMPDFPGIEKAESTGDWEVGFELTYKIRPKDEDYWKQRRGTPKAFVTLDAGLRMWTNRFGDYTAVRWDAAGDPSALSNRVASHVLKTLKPADVGLRFEGLRDKAFAAAGQSQDFGQLFLGFSMFIVISALLLVALLFSFAVEQRSEEVGTFISLGFTRAEVGRLWLLEGFLLALMGAAIGSVLGMLYAKAMLWGLTTLWRDAVGASSLYLEIRPATALLGVALGTATATAALWVTIRQLSRRMVTELFVAGGAPEGRSTRKHKIAPLLALTIVSALAAFGLVAYSLGSRHNANPGAFFGAGALLLVSGIAAVSLWLRGVGRTQSALTLRTLGVRSNARRRKRGVTTVALLASGCFIIVAVSAFRLEAERDAASRSSGTGGFVLLGQSAIGVVHDLNARAGREFYGLREEDLTRVRIVPFRVREGDEASCLNLNRAQNPRLIAVDPALLEGRFTFAGREKGLPDDAGWQRILRGRQGATGSIPEIPAVGDANSIQWALHKKLGDTIDYVDEMGRPFKIRLTASVANSVLQGNLVVDESAFTRTYPSESGYRFFLVDADQTAVTNVSAALTRALQDVGLELTPSVRRLNEFNAVQNTYLGAFQILGGMGLLLGSAGLGTILLRNVFERRGELGLLSAVGFSKSSIGWMLLAEHGILLVWGLGVGISAAVVAVLPAIVTPGTPLPMRSLGIMLLLVVLNGALWTWVATRGALRGSLLAALRNE